MSKHTPGSWLVQRPHDHPSDSRTIGVYVYRHGWIVQPYSKTANPEVDREHEANMYLIAAAPDLYNACKLQHEAIDTLFAMLIMADPSFRPTQSGAPWKAIVAGKMATYKAENG